MKIHFDNVNLQALTGPNTFASRLAKKLFEMGHSCQFDSKDADVSLVFIEPSGAPLAPKVVQRLDGIWFKPGEFATKNKGILDLYNKANAVIFQSRFDEGMVTRWWGAPARDRNGDSHASSYVIHNGIDLNQVKEITIPKLVEMRQTFDHIYVCSSNWHAQKRLEANVRLFYHLREKHPNSCLIVMGNHPDTRLASPNIFFSGPVPPETYLQIYSAANWMLHLAWADHCPNVVIEALSQGTPVVCCNVGGTKELIGTYGIILKDEPYNYDLADYDNPPTIDVKQLTELPDRQQLDYSSIADIDINNVATRYAKVLEGVCQ